MEFYITKFSLTTGIYKAYSKDTPTGVLVRTEGAVGCHVQKFSDQDWHTSKESAIKRAEEMKKIKIISLEKQLKKIRTLTF